MTPEVSVIMPVHNRERVLHRAIDSVLNQSFSDLELIVVDDGSTDKSVDVVQSYKDPRIRLVRIRQNGGAAAARNRGLEKAKGRFICFLDSDDEWLETKVEEQIQLLRKLPDKVGLVYTGAYYVSDNDLVRIQKPRHRGNVLRYLLTSNVIVGSTSGVMVRREVIQDIGGFDETLPARQDIDLWLRISTRYDVDYVAKPLVRIYRLKDPGRISMNKTALAQGRAIFLEKHRSLIEGSGALATYLRGTGVLYQSTIGDWETARQYYLESLKLAPWVPTTYLRLLTTLISEQIYTKLKDVKSSWSWRR